MIVLYASEAGKRICIYTQCARPYIAKDMKEQSERTKCRKSVILEVDKNVREERKQYAVSGRSGSPGRQRNAHICDQTWGTRQE